MSNRFVLIEREQIHPCIEGVDFGGKTYVIARSPTAVLIWTNGHSQSINGHQRYVEPVLVVLPDRRSRGNIRYQHVQDGGRMSRKMLFECWPKLSHFFEEDARPWIRRAIKTPKMTLLIEGGGPKLMPSRYGGRAEYLKWLDIPKEDRGFWIGGDR